MKSTGVIRRIDELGRIVIPKEIRRHLGIREGENLEIFTDSDQIILKKYSRIYEYGDFSNKICEVLSSVLDVGAFVTDRDKVIAYSDHIKLDLNNQNIKEPFLKSIQEREIYESSISEMFQFGNYEIQGYFYAQPIISASDCLGLVVFIKDNPFIREEKLFAKFVGEIIANKIDIL